MFECKICGYSTDRSTDLERHNKTKRHINKILEHENNAFKCIYCNRTFTAKTNMYRHQKYNCTNIQIGGNQNDNFIKNTQDCALYEDRIKKLEHANEFLQNQNADLLKLTLQNSENAGKSIRGITYAMKHLNNAQQLKLLKKNEAVKLLTYDNNKSKNDTVEIIIVKHRNKLLDKYLGDILVRAYKKDDPEIQSIWNVDTTRLHFILKEKEWTSDNCGIKLTNFVIDPFLKSMETMIHEYCRLHNDERMNFNRYVETNIGDNICTDTNLEFEMFTQKWGFCQEILIDISKKKLHKQILKHISSRLKLSLDTIKDKQTNQDIYVDDKKILTKLCKNAKKTNKNF